MQRAAALGLVELLPDGRVRVADERFVTTGAALARLGVPAPAILDEWEHLADTMAGVATRFVAVFEEHLLPHDWRDALTGDEAEHLAAALGELRRQAETVVVAALDRAIADLARERLGELLDGDA